MLTTPTSNHVGWELFPLLYNYKWKDKGILDILALTLRFHWSHWCNSSSNFLLNISVCGCYKCPIWISHSLWDFLLFAAESILTDRIINIFQMHIPCNVTRYVAKKEGMYTQQGFRNTMFNSVQHAFLLQDSLEALIYAGISKRGT